LAHPDDSQRALTAPPADVSVEVSPASPRSLARSTVAGVFVAALSLCVLAYLAYAVPGRWFSSAADKAYPARQLTMPRGTATIVGDELIVSRAADDGNTVISVTTDFRSVDYPVVAWIAAGVAAGTPVALLWRTDVEPARVNKRVLEIDSGQLVPIDVQGDPHWIGRVVGLALFVQGPIEQPLRVRGVVARPGTALETLRDRVREWMAPEPWTGASINTIAGGADLQPLPLPLMLAVALLVSVAVIGWLQRRRRGPMASVARAGFALVVVAWFALDARWMVNLVRQAQATASQYAGKDAHEKLLAGQDRDLVAFIDKARMILPKEPARIFVVADADFHRGRAAYHLYPHNVWYEPYRNAVPPADQLRAGDWLVVFQRRGVQYDAARHSLRWDAGATVPVELKLLDHGGALFIVQ
jgi:hypothetical protein